MNVDPVDGNGMFSIPKFTVSRVDVEGFMDELKGFHGAFRDCFSRTEPRENFFRYMVGQFSELERKSVKPIALTVEGGDVRSMQRMVSDVQWDEELLLRRYHGLLRDDMGDGKGIVILDETSFVKKGDDAIGVARQYCGSLGKVENCQVGVFAAYASPDGYALLDKRLFIPEKWFWEPYQARRETCKLPESTVFRTKVELAIEMLEQTSTAGIIPFRYVVADTVYGKSIDVMNAVDKLPGVVSLLAVPSDTLCWLKPPLTEERPYNDGGERRSKKILSERGRTPVTVSSYALNLNTYFWYRRVVSEGTKGPITYEFARRQVTLHRDGLPCKDVWLLVKRTLGPEPVYSYSISNAPSCVRLRTLIWLSGARWAIEQCFEEATSEWGMDHYEVRKFPGWHHHMLTTMLSHVFLWHLTIRLGEKSTLCYTVAAENSPGNHPSTENIRC